MAAAHRDLLPADSAAYLAEEVPRAIEQSLEGLQRIASIVQSVKEFSHPREKDASHADVNELLGKAIAVSRNEWKYSSELLTEFDRTIPAILCYPSELGQVFLNVLVNAGHAMRDKGSGGTLRITTRREPHHVLVSIADTGTGIPEAVRARIFDPFFTTKPVGSGTGQGLAIAHTVVVDLHGGTIDFDTEEGVGTCFHIRLPIDPQPRSELTAPARSAA
jgi:signal transduction histidine kinase